MVVLDLLATLRERGITVCATPAEVRVRPRDAATPDLFAALRGAKEALLRLLPRSGADPVWLVPDVMAAEALVAHGISRGRVWTVAEARDLLALAPEGASAVVTVKTLFDGEVTEVRPHVRTCPTCRGQRWWRSVAGQTVCVTCHPPPSPDLVAQWLESLQ